MRLIKPNQEDFLYFTSIRIPPDVVSKVMMSYRFNAL